MYDGIINVYKGEDHILHFVFCEARCIFRLQHRTRRILRVRLGSKKKISGKIREQWEELK